MLTYRRIVALAIFHTAHTSSTPQMTDDEICLFFRLVEELCSLAEYTGV